MTGSVSIAWAALLRVSSEEQANKLIVRIHERLDLPMDLGEIERYWRDETLYRCSFSTRIPDVDEAALVGSALAIAQRLAPGWHVSGAIADGNLEAVASTGIAVPGVTWLSLTASR